MSVLSKIEKAVEDEIQHEAVKRTEHLRRSIRAEIEDELSEEKRRIKRIAAALTDIEARKTFDGRIAYTVMIDDRMLFDDLNDRDYLFEHWTQEVKHRFKQLIRPRR